MNKILKSLSSNFFLSSDRDYDANFKKFKKYGVFACDFQEFIHYDNELHSLSEDDFVAYLKNIKNAADKYGITIFQAHGAWPTVDDSEQGRKAFEKVFEKQIFGASILGSKYIIYHPCFPFGWGIEKDKEEIYRLNIERFTMLSKIARKYNMNVCIENMPFVDTEISYTKNIVKLLDYINEDNLFICFDTGHSKCLKEDIYDSIKLCGSRLKCIHVHDNKFNMDLHLPPRFGEVDFERFNQALKEINYQGTYNLEIGNTTKTENEEKTFVGFLNTFLDESIKSLR